MASNRELELRQKSGNQSSSDPVTVLLYMLAKDYLKPQQLEEIVAKLEAVMPGVVVFNNGWLGQYAKELSGKLGSLGGAAVDESGGVRSPVSKLDWGSNTTDGKGKATPTSCVDGVATKTEHNVPATLKATNTVSARGSMMDVLPHLEKTMSAEEVDQIRRDIQEFEGSKHVEDLFDNLIVKGK
jgi:hypothetical protein